MTNDTSSSLDGLRGAMARGSAARRVWLRAGEVIPLKGLAERWRTSVAALDAAIGRGALFAVEVAGGECVPAEFVELDIEAVGAICQALDGLELIEKLIFWKRKHGVLAGKTVRDSLMADPKDGVGRVVQLAREHSAAARSASIVDMLGQSVDIDVEFEPPAAFSRTRDTDRR